MATLVQPTQALPSWLTLVSSVVTDSNGDLSTEFATMTLPLTYFGPPIPLGTDGVWTYGGLTPPPSVTVLPTPTPSSAISTPSSESLSSSAGPSSSFASSSTSSAVSSSTSPVPTGGSASRGISASVLGAILGSALGFILLVLIALIIFLLLRQRRRNKNLEDPGQGSSFWSRSIFTRRASRSPPIWTEWEVVEGGGARTHAEDLRSPGEGSPRGSGEEHDPFLTRRSLHSGTAAEEMTQTKTGTETLVSMPAPAIVSGGTPRPSPPRPGHIVDPEILHRMMDEQDELHTPPPGIRLVDASPQTNEDSPLLPPRRLDPDGLAGVGGLRPSGGSKGSLGSHKHSRSIGSQKSMGSLDMDEGAELLTARRVKVGEAGTPRTISTSQLNDPEPSSSTGPRATLGLADLGGRLGRLSWFKRMSGSGAPSDSPLVVPAVDPYTSSPTRSHYRQQSHSRPSSWRPFDSDANPNTTPTASRNSRASGLGFLVAGSRPISSVSARSAASGNTVYHDALSTPVADNSDIPSTVADAGSPTEMTFSQSGSSTQRAGGAGGYSSAPSEPPTYDDSQRQREVDILDLPAPAPASPFTSSRPAFPPGLVSLPTPRTWRDSYSSHESPATHSSTGLNIDVLEEEPPLAQEGWRSLASGEGGMRNPRRTTFGTPVVVHQQSRISEEASLHSMRSHLSPYASHSPSGSAPASRHTLTGSNSSRPSGSGHSQEPTGSSGFSLEHSSSIEFDRRRPRSGDVGEVNIASPPLSAVFGGRSGRGSMTMGSPPSTRPASPLPGRGMGTIDELASSSSRTPLLPGDGTVASSRTNDTNTNSSVTTALTDPITGARMHFPSVPYRNPLLDAEHRSSWNSRPSSNNDDMW